MRQIYPNLDGCVINGEALDGSWVRVPRKVMADSLAACRGSNPLFSTLL